MQKAMSLFDLRAGYRTLYQYLNGKICEKSAPKAAAREIADLNDELPGDLGAPKPNGRAGMTPDEALAFLGN